MIYVPLLLFCVVFFELFLSRRIGSDAVAMIARSQEAMPVLVLRHQRRRQGRCWCVERRGRSSSPRCVSWRKSGSSESHAARVVLVYGHCLP